MIEQLLSPELVHALGWTLVHSLWQGAIFALLLGLLLIGLRRFSARARYLVAVGLLTGFALTVAVTLVRLYPTGGVGELADYQQLTTATETHAGPLSRDLPVALNPPAAAGPEATIRPAFRQRMTDYYNAHLPLIVTLWLLGVLILQLRFLGQLAFVQRLKTYGTERFPAHWAARIQELEEGLGIRRSVRYLTSFRTHSPLTVGWLRPVILFPAPLLAELKDSQIVAILAHELAHIKRNDFLVNLAQAFLRTFFFYHPGVWWMSARIGEEREHCCDDLAVQLTGRPVGYAKTLVRLKESDLTGSSLAMAYTGAAGRGFKLRITRLLSGYLHGATYGEGIVTGLIFVLALGIAVTASGRQQELIRTNGMVEPTHTLTGPGGPPPPPPPPPPSGDFGGEESSDPGEETDSDTELTSPGEEVDLTDFDLFIRACYEGETELVRYFIGRGMEINRTDERDFTPLMAAASENHVEVARLLIQAGAEVNFLNQHGWTALIEAADEGSLEVARLLLESGAEVNLRGPESNRSALGMAASEGHEEMALLLLNSGADLYQAGGQSAIHLAAEEGRQRMIDLLVKRGVDINATDERGRTALSYAAEEDQTEVVRFLLAAGADPQRVDDHGRIALDYAAAEGADGSFELLIEAATEGHYDADESTTEKRQRQEYGRSLLNPHLLVTAAAEGHLDIVKKLLAAGLDPDDADREGRTALMAAAAENHPRMIELLLKNGARTENGCNINDTSIDRKQDGTTVTVLSFYRGATPLIVAISEKNTAAVRALLTGGADANGNCEKMKMEVAGDRDWNDPNAFSPEALRSLSTPRYEASGWTPLLEAVETGDTELVDQLLRAGADRTQATRQGLTPLQLARELNYPAIVKRLGG